MRQASILGAVGSVHDHRPLRLRHPTPFCRTARGHILHQFSTLVQVRMRVQLMKLRVNILIHSGRVALLERGRLVARGGIPGPAAAAVNTGSKDNSMRDAGQLVHLNGQVVSEPGCGYEKAIDILEIPRLLCALLSHHIFVRHSRLIILVAEGTDDETLLRSKA
eukprot:CAMPEP_0205900794 /NCGR_PEP_ID=MMETSP1083-20121108/27332_1 /ASSEMBLY_ACC=CAM_ASM_000430 /TAXON_ID=97485 /ORGANISM="Prymnesium parvum, Strain Texoma1" /LENGTH=163 /DNA_ID=CAMNT_0053266267 /DNA_START=298 /DNA_END=789 /DNA_ORIENTATION=-